MTKRITMTDEVSIKFEIALLAFKNARLLQNISLSRSDRNAFLDALLENWSGERKS